MLMFKQICEMIKRDKWKWLALVLGVILIKMFEYTSLLWLKILPANLYDNNLFISIITVFSCLLVFPITLSFGFFIYWAGKVKIDAKTSRPWFFWGSLLLLVTVVLMGKYLLSIWGIAAIDSNQITIVQYSQYKSIVSILHLSLKYLVTVVALFPFALSVWENRSTRNGYLGISQHWGKGLAWLIGRTILFLIPFVLVQPLTAHIPPENILTINLIYDGFAIFDFLGNGVLIYWMAAWIMGEKTQPQ